MAHSAETWNGATSLSTPDITGATNGRVALFYKAVRGADINQYLPKAADENITDAFLLAFNLRDCRGGKGERKLGREALRWLFLTHPDAFQKVLPLVADYGRWDDLLVFFPKYFDLTSLEVVTSTYNLAPTVESHLDKARALQKEAVSLFARQLAADKEAMENGSSCSLAAKWAPSEKSSDDRKYGLVSTLAKEMGVNPDKYRKQYLTPLRSYIGIVEKFMCEKRWDEIEFSKVPSCAMKRLKKAFAKNAEAAFNEWKEKLNKGEVDVKGKQLYAHELIKEIRDNKYDIVSQKQWEVLEEETRKLGSLNKALVVVDVSGSMFGGYGSVAPIDVACALGLLVSGCVAEGDPFRDLVITFHEVPAFYKVTGNNLKERYQCLSRAPWGMSTNFQAVFKMILDKAKQSSLSQEDMPDKVIVISDMQFNHAGSSTNFQAIEKQYAESGYKRPQIVFWNVNGTTPAHEFPVNVQDDGTALISGFSTSVLKSIINGKDFNPYAIMRETIDDERYAPVKRALE